MITDDDSLDPLLSSINDSHACICCDREICDFKRNDDASSHQEERELSDVENFDKPIDEIEDNSVFNDTDQWMEFFDRFNREDTGIQEIFLNNVEDKFSRPVGPRKRYQRFREKRFICDQCQRCFTLKQNVQFHILTYHLGDQQIAMSRGKRFVCMTCEKIFKCADAARRHNERDHMRLPNVQIHRCSICTRIFGSGSQLKEHISIQHLQEKPYSCEHCGAKFGRQGGLRRHFLMVHTDRKFSCIYPECTHPGFKCSKALTAHIRSCHTKDRPFVCGECGKRFVRRNDQKVHELLHSTTEQYHCTRCGQRFRRQIYLKKHERLCRVAAST